MEDKLLTRAEKWADVIFGITYVSCLANDLAVTYYQNFAEEQNLIYKSVAESNGPLSATIVTGGCFALGALAFLGASKLVKKLDKSDKLHSFVIKSLSLYPYLSFMAANHFFSARTWAYS